jgi:hypothetical protein
MNVYSASGSPRTFIVYLAFAMILPVMSVGQGGYHVRQITAREGLPQNSIRQLVFDDQGFLWMATEAGIARFDGRSVRVYGDGDHPGLSNRRFTHAIRCADSTILFVDQLSGMFRLAGGRFTTLQAASGSNPDVPAIRGSLPNCDIILDDPAFAETIGKMAIAEGVAVFPVTRDSLFIVGKDMRLHDASSRRTGRIQRGEINALHVAMIGRRVFYVDAQGRFVWLDASGADGKALCVVDGRGQVFHATMNGTRMFSKWPFRSAFLKDGESLFRLRATESPDTLAIERVVDRLPANCQLKSVEERADQGLTFIGTDLPPCAFYIACPRRWWRFVDERVLCPGNHG